MKSSFLLGAFVVFGSFVACTPTGDIRVVKTSKTGGEMALIGVRDLARQKAEAEMARTCGANNFEVLEEGEAVVGQVEHSQGNAQNTRTIFGRPAVSTSSTSETTQKTEWRLKYSCKGSENAAGKPQQGAKIHEVVVVF